MMASDTRRGCAKREENDQNVYCKYQVINASWKLFTSSSSKPSMQWSSMAIVWWENVTLNVHTQTWRHIHMYTSHFMQTHTTTSTHPNPTSTLPSVNGLVAIVSVMASHIASLLSRVLVMECCSYEEIDWVADGNHIIIITLLQSHYCKNHR